MKRKYLITAGIIFVSVWTQAQVDLNSLGKKLNDAKGTVTGNGTKALSNEDVVKGLKEALTIGSKNSSDAASKVDGYLKNPKIKIPFPPDVQRVETTLRNMGMNKQVDAFVVSLNRAAEDAAKSAVPVFSDAITKMTITDGMKILKGTDDAATNFLKQSTNAELLSKFKPIIKSSLQKVQVTKYWNPLASKYNQIPMVNKVNPDLEDYVTRKAIEGLFVLVAQEELKIRKNPVARVTDILKKVFGN